MIVKRIELLIKEIDPADKNGRYMRENLRRIKLYFDDLVDQINNNKFLTNQLLAQGFNYSEEYLVTVSNQTLFTLKNTPAEPEKVRMTINGVEMVNGSHFKVVGKTVTFFPSDAGFILENINELGEPDKVVFQYLIAA